ncbi:MAG: hypothetical protein LOD84_02620, partial [Limnochordales bacterium]
LRMLRAARFVSQLGFTVAPRVRRALEEMSSQLSRITAERVAAELDKDNQDYGTVYKGDGGRDPAQDPGAEIWIGFAGGLRAYLSALKTNPEEMNIRLIGSRGSIILRQREAELELASGWRVTKQSAPLERFSRSGEMAAIYELIQIYETGQGTTQCPPREAYKTVRLLLGALASNAAGGARVPV